MRFNKHGKMHRPNGPAREWSGGLWVWYINGNPHRYYGPAHFQGAWFIHGFQVKDNDI